MQIRTIQKGLKAFECKFEAFESYWKHSNAHSSHSKGIRSIQMQIWIIWKTFEAFQCKFEPFERDSNHSKANSNLSKGIRSIPMEILTIRKGFEVFNCEFEHFQKGFIEFECKFEPFKRDSKLSNANSNHSKGIRSIRMEIRMIRKGFEAFKWKF